MRHVSRESRSAMDSATAARRASELSFWKPGVEIVPASEQVAALGLGCGRTNQNFIATYPNGGGRFFVRIGLDLPEWGVTRVKEQAAARAAAASGIGAAVVHAELPDVLVTEFVDGRALTEAQVHAAVSGDDEPMLRALTAAMRKLHATPLPAELLEGSHAAPRWSPPDLQHWIAYARKGGYSRLPLLDDCDALIAKAESFVESGWPAAAPAFCHFDLLPDNFVVRREGEQVHVAIVDFEYTNPGQPRMDLAILSMGCALSAAEERRLLAGYLQVDAIDDADASRFLALKMLATLRETFWGVLAEVSGASALTPEAAASYVDENYVKYVAARKEFEACLAPRSA